MLAPMIPSKGSTGSALLLPGADQFEFRGCDHSVAGLCVIILALSVPMYRFEHRSSCRANAIQSRKQLDAMEDAVRNEHVLRVQRAVLTCWLSAWRAHQQLAVARGAAGDLLASRLLCDWKAEMIKTHNRCGTGNSLVDVYIDHSIVYPTTVSVGQHMHAPSLVQCLSSTVLLNHNACATAFVCKSHLFSSDIPVFVSGAPT